MRGLFLCFWRKVYRSTLIPQNLLCPEKFLVARMEKGQKLDWHRSESLQQQNLYDSLRNDEAEVHSINRILAFLEISRADYEATFTNTLRSTERGKISPTGRKISITTVMRPRYWIFKRIMVNGLHLEHKPVTVLLPRVPKRLM